MKKKAKKLPSLREQTGEKRELTEKELHKLRRVELLELLIEQLEENEALSQKLAQAEARLEDRRIFLERAGSIAEASLKLNGVFEAAQAAADQYLENLDRLREEWLSYNLRLLTSPPPKEKQTDAPA